VEQAIANITNVFIDFIIERPPNEIEGRPSTQLVALEGRMSTIDTRSPL
jgi:hypothetical protein